MRDGLASRRLRDLARRMQSHIDRANRGTPPEAGLAVPGVPPRGPGPLAGGAAAPFEFDD
jgi:hypothetical protein